MGLSCPLCLLAVVVAFALGCGAFGAIMLDRVRSVQQAEFAAGHIADLAANRTADQLRRISADLDAVAAASQAGAPDPASLARVDRAIAQRRGMSPDMLGLVLIDGTGRVIAGALTPGARPATLPPGCVGNLSLDPGAVTMRPAMLARDGADPAGVICILRGIEAGNHAATVLELVGDDLFQAEYADLSPGPHSMIALLNEAGRRLATVGTFGRRVPTTMQSVAWRELLRGGTPALGEGIAEARRIDGPIHGVVVVAIADADALAAWWARAGLLGSSALIVIAFVALAVLGARRVDLRELLRLEGIAALAAELQGVCDSAVLTRRIVDTALELVPCQEVPEPAPASPPPAAPPIPYAPMSPPGRPMVLSVVESNLVRIGPVLLRRRGGRYFSAADLACLRALVAVAQGGLGTATALHAAANEVRHFRELAEQNRLDAETAQIEMSDAVITLDTHWRFVGSNRNADRLLGEHADDLRHRPIWEVFPELVGTVFETECRRAMQDGHPVSFDLRWLRSDVWLSVNAYPRMPGLAIYLQDISRHVVIDDKLRQSAKMEAIGRLTGAIAHDFNNLLTVILGNVETLDLELPESGEIRDMLEQIRRAAENAAGLTRQLLAFARRQSLAPADVDVARLVRGLDGLLRHTLGAAFTLDIRCPAALWLARIDPIQLEGAIVSLAHNARDAMPAGGRLTIEAANLAIRKPDADQFGEIRPGNYVALSVSDTGSGISPDVLDKVFDPFFSTKSASRGAGLGLSMVYGFVTQSGGHVRIASEPGRGTTVRLYLPSVGGKAGLPAAAASADGAHPGATPPGHPGAGNPGAGHPGGSHPTGGHQAGGHQGGRERILVVEDAEMVRDYATGVLTGLGYDVGAAADGRAALQMLDGGFNPDMLLTDVLLPDDLDGIALASQVRARRPGIAVAYMSGYVENGDTYQGQLDPQENLLLKPFARAALAAMVRRQLDHS